MGVEKLRRSQAWLGCLFAPPPLSPPQATFMAVFVFFCFCSKLQTLCAQLWKVSCPLDLRGQGN